MLPEQIKNDLNNNRLPQAIIIQGSDEETRFKTAKELSMAIMCTADTKPCGNCSHCLKVFHDSHPDLHLIEKESKKTFIVVDDIREAKRIGALRPNDGEKSVFIIKEAQNMNAQAQNALLKVFEEPLPHLSFILTAPSVSAFLDTIISRGTIYTLSEEDEKPDESDSAYILADELCRLLIEENEYSFLIKSSEIKKDKEFAKKVLDNMDAILTGTLIEKSKKSPLNGTFAKLERNFDSAKLIKLINTTEKLKSRLLANANFNLFSCEFVSDYFN